ncbi:transcription factor bHLH94-like isoform X2 [Cicer arietinum]|uniref:Transcription factor bHLH94-like n=1 Tax=Cicer arietinum TaxID=3827 RepID=A0A1S2Z8T6_CICAR|nr:transcription factor bHLH94-like [Cicer arietinum]
MVLEAMVYPRDQFTHNSNEYLYSFVGTNASERSWHQNQIAEENDVFGIINKKLDHNIQTNWDSSSPSLLQNVIDKWDSNPSLLTSTIEATATTTTTCRRKRRHIKCIKNEVEIENQRMTHITVERNRRKQMNEYFAVLRSLMPPSYAQRGDQASIVGGAINFVKELEQLLHCMKGEKKKNEQVQENGLIIGSSPFAEFFTFPQYSTWLTQSNTCYISKQNQSRAMSDIEVTLVDNHANIKIILKKRHGQVMKMVVGLQNLGFNVLHLNVATADDMVLVSLSIKVEEGCHHNTGDEIAAAVNQLSRTI